MASVNISLVSPGRAAWSNWFGVFIGNSFRLRSFHHQDRRSKNRAFLAINEYTFCAFQFTFEQDWFAGRKFINQPGQRELLI
jgi:hypothetical protein